MSLPFYRRFPRKFIEGTVGMPLEVKGAYSILLDLIYAHSGKLVDDAQFIAGVLGCSVRKWNSIRERLISAGKIQVENGIISNLQADAELESCRKVQDKQAENRRRPNKNNNIKSPNHHLKDKDKESPLTPRTGGMLDQLKEKGVSLSGEVLKAGPIKPAEASDSAWWMPLKAKLRADHPDKLSLITPIRITAGRRLVVGNAFDLFAVLEVFGPALGGEGAASVLVEGGDEFVFDNSKEGKAA